ncbi:hypothetical protein DFH11DRAFT_1544834 [Phellopilus nigrolimitatus]|nr:hypothetical protein DFH11DRAFT_1544834 [Phellopilus nigrolimitatus]
MSEARHAAQRFKKNPRQTIISARNGSIADLEVLASERRVPPSLLPELFDMLCSHFRQRPHGPSGSIVIKPLSVVRLSLASMRIFPLSFFKNPIMSEWLLEAWPDIFRSLRSLYNGTMPGDPPSDTLLMFRTILTHISESRNAIVLKELPVIGFAARIWFSELTLTEDQNTASQILSFCITSCPNAEAYGVLTQIAGYSERAIAELALSRLKSTLSRRSKLSLSCMHIRLKLVSDLCSGPLRQTFRFAIRNRHGIAIILKAISRTWEDALSVHSESAMNAIGEGLMTLLKFSGNSACIGQAMRHNVLRAFAEACPYINEDDGNAWNEVIEAHLSAFFPQYPITYCRLKTTLRAMEGVEVTGKCNLLRQGPGRIGEYWEAFERLVAGRSIIQHLLYRCSFRSFRTRCDNMFCEEAVPTSVLRKCSACRSVLYCSKSCQELAWKEQLHSNVCRALIWGKLQYEVSSNLSERDKNYLIFHAILEARRHLPSIRAHSDLYFPDDPYEHIALEVDICSYPTRFSIYELSSPSLFEDTDIFSAGLAVLRNCVLRKAQKYCKRDVPTLFIIPCPDRRNDDNPLPPLVTLVDLHWSMSDADVDGSVLETILRAGEDAGGTVRVPGKWGKMTTADVQAGSEPMECEYDVIDELVRRAQIISANSAPSLPIWNRDIIQVAMDEFLENIEKVSAESS